MSSDSKCDWEDSFLERCGYCSCYHDEEIKRSKQCGCYYCLRMFPPVEIDEWYQNHTADCPYCGVDAVIGDGDSMIPLSVEFLRAMHDHWFVNKSPALGPLAFGLEPNEMLHEKFLPISGDRPIMRVTHLPTGTMVELEQDDSVSIIEFHRQLLLELARKISESKP